VKPAPILSPEQIRFAEELPARLARIEEFLRDQHAASKEVRRIIRPPGLLSLSAAARRLGRSKATLRRLIDEGAVRAVPWPGRRAKDAIPLQEVERVEREGVSRPVSPEPKKSPRRARGTGRSERAAAVAAILAIEEN